MEDWAFGLTHRDRRPKPALTSVGRPTRRCPSPAARDGPGSRRVCAYNAESTIRSAWTPPCGWTIPTTRWWSSMTARPTPPRNSCSFPGAGGQHGEQGLSSARNTGLGAADGEIVAYLDSDAYPDPQWLRYLAHAFTTTDHVAVGDPNLPPPGDGVIAECVARSPGGPARTAHRHGGRARPRQSRRPRVRAAGDRRLRPAIPGGRRRRRRLLAAAGPRRDARVQPGSVGLAPPPQLRPRVLAPAARLRSGGGPAGAQVAGRYNAGGHFRWAGRIYDRGLTRHLLRAQRIYHGSWGTAPSRPSTSRRLERCSRCR